MKKLLILLLSISFGLSTAVAENFETTCYYTRGFNYHYTNAPWNEWTPLNVQFCISPYVLTINTKTPQYFTVQSSENLPLVGTEIVKDIYYCKDQDGVRCNVIFRFYLETDNTMQAQIYVEYSNIIYVYDITQE